MSALPAEHLTSKSETLLPGQQALLRITQAIATALSLDELLLLALRELTQLFGLPHGAMLLVDEAEQMGRIACEFPPRVAQNGSFRLADDPLLTEGRASHQPIAISDLAATPPGPVVSRMLADQPASSLLLLPLYAQDRLLGLLSLSATGERREFGPDQMVLGRVLASQLALAISTVSLYDDARRRRAELETLNEIAATVTSSLDSHQVYKLIVQKLNEFFSVDAGSILLLDEQTSELVFVMTIEAGAEKLAGVRVPPGTGVVGHVASTQQPYIVRDAANDPLFYSKVSEDVGFVTRSILCVPMLVKGRTVGVIELLNKLDGEFTESEAARLQAMANTVAVAIENARLFQEVARGHNRLQAILNSTEDAIIMVETDGMVATANPMIEELFGLPWRSLIGRPGAEVLAELESHMQPIATPRIAMQDEPASEIIDFEILEPRRRYVRQVKLPVQSDGAIIGQLVVLHDMTEERELERMREDWTGMLVHDLRSPLTAILNGMTMVRRGLVGPVNDMQREMLDISTNSGQAMLGMINTLLDIGKLEAGQMQLDRQPCLLYEVADAALERVVASARSAEIALVNQLPPGVPPIEIDREKIIRVLQNLLDNAIKFTPARGQVTLLAELDADQAVTLSIRDTGPGIPAAYRERIFEKFGQVEGERKVKGTGLGLTFCKLAIEAHGGTIWVDSEPGQGSVFSFRLPILEASS